MDPQPEAQQPGAKTGVDVAGEIDRGGRGHPHTTQLIMYNAYGDTRRLSSCTGRLYDTQLHLSYEVS